jgi:UV DNA damage endonuclease
LGSPRPEVIANAIRDLEYHDEMLSLLKLPPQPDRDAVIILHMGGTFGDKAATIDRFRSNYKDLSPSIKQRLVLENDDVSWSVHDLLPVCEELNIPFCLDFHHHNIIFDSSQVREGTLDIMSLFPRIKATWDRKGMKQKMHYSEATPEAVTRNQRRKHNARPSTLPPCPNDMDLMIEAKDKEQAIFELMRTYKLPGWDNFNDIIPYERVDENNVQPKKSKKKSKKQIKKEIEEFGRELSEEEEVKEEIKEEDIGMGGKENRVYWPVGMEEWLRPKKREVKKKNGMDEEEMFKNPTPANFAARKAVMARNKEPLNDETKERLRNATNVADIQKILEDIKKERIDQAAQENAKNSKPKKEAKPRKATPVKKKTAKSTQKRGVSNLEDEEDEDLSMPDLSSADDDEIGETTKMTATAAEQPRQSGRVKGKRKSYTETEIDQEED